MTATVLMYCVCVSPVEHPQAGQARGDVQRAPQIPRGPQIPEPHAQPCMYY